MMPQLCWSGVQGAANYHVTVWRPEDWQSAYREQGYLPSSSTCYQVPNGWLQSGASYRWEVRAFSSGGQPSAWSNVLYFQTPAASTPADLVVNSVSYSPDPPVSGSSVTLTCNYSNSASGGTAASGFDVRISIDGGTPQSTTSSALAPGSSDSKSFTFSSYAAGSHTVVCTVNDNRAATESNYQNSGATFTKTWSAAPTTPTPAEKPDFAVSSLFVGANPTAGQAANVTCKYANQGPGSAPAGYRVEIGVDTDLAVVTSNGPALAVNGQNTLTRSVTVNSGGSHTLYCYVNQNQAVPENNGNYANSGYSTQATWANAVTQNPQPGSAPGPGTLGLVGAVTHGYAMPGSQASIDVAFTLSGADSGSVQLRVAILDNRGPTRLVGTASTEMSTTGGSHLVTIWWNVPRDLAAGDYDVAVWATFNGEAAPRAAFTQISVGGASFVQSHSYPGDRNAVHIHLEATEAGSLRAGAGNSVTMSQLYAFLVAGGLQAPLPSGVRSLGDDKTLHTIPETGLDVTLLPCTLSLVPSSWTSLCSLAWRWQEGNPTQAVIQDGADQLGLLPVVGEALEANYQKRHLQDIDITPLGVEETEGKLFEEICWWSVLTGPEGAGVCHIVLQGLKVMAKVADAFSYYEVSTAFGATNIAGRYSIHAVAPVHFAFTTDANAPAPNADEAIHLHLTGQDGSPAVGYAVAYHVDAAFTEPERAGVAIQESPGIYTLWVHPPQALYAARFTIQVNAVRVGEGFGATTTTVEGVEPANGFPSTALLSLSVTTQGDQYVVKEGNAFSVKTREVGVDRVAVSVSSDMHDGRIVLIEIPLAYYMAGPGILKVQLDGKDVPFTWNAKEMKPSQLEWSLTQSTDGYFVALSVPSFSTHDVDLTLQSPSVAPMPTTQPPSATVQPPRPARSGNDIPSPGFVLPFASLLAASVFIRRRRGD